MASKDADDVPVSSLVAKRGIKTSADFADFMGGLMSDLVDGRIKPDVATAACKAGDSMLRIVELEMEYNGDGTPISLAGHRRKEFAASTQGKLKAGAEPDSSKTTDSENPKGV